MAKTKRVPNPNGRKGSLAHQNLVSQIIDYIISLGYSPDTEHGIRVKNGTKRYADAVGLDKNDDPAVIFQVGKQNQDGTPVKRERDAIAEIEEATGIKVTFTAYNVTITLLIFCATFLTAAMFYYHYTQGVQFAFFGM